jgi:tRNA threonylcarbamoyladenosine biosynthesis protein TsaB
MLRLLALDASTEACSVALLDGDTLRELHVEAPREHMLRLLPMVDELLAQSSLALRDLDAIAFARGPGSFTGLRICLGVVQGLAFGAGLPVIPVSTLAALAQTRADGESEGTQILAAIDARMDEVYWCAYRVGASGLVEPLGDEYLGAPEAVESPAGSDRRIGAGTGWQYRSRIRGEGFAVIDDRALPTASAILRLARPVWLAGSAVGVEDVVPVYLRDKVV